MAKRRAAQVIVIAFFILSMVIAFWLINYDEMIRAFIAIFIIVGWFYAILVLEIKGVIRFSDSENALNGPDKPDKSDT